MTELGLVIYPGAQQAAVLGLTDLFEVANRIVDSHRAAPEPTFRVTHWQQDDASRTPRCVFDSRPDAPAGTLAALILPPALGKPANVSETSPLAAWLRDRHAQGVVLTSVCAGAFPLASTGLLAGRRMTTH